MTVLVIGNATVDISFELDQLPERGQTLLARSRMIDAGGKGLNQAIVANRAGIDVIYIAPIGNDPEAEFIRGCVTAEGLPVHELLSRPAPTDLSIIYLDARGENTIVSTAGMARSLRADEAFGAIDRLGHGDILLMQGNLMRDTTEACLRRARGRGIRTILNPAPIAFNYEGLWPFVDLAVVNEVETRISTGVPDPYAAADVLMSWGAGVVVTTLGADGALITDRGGTRAVPAPAVHAVDTAGAGDVFCGVLAASLAGGRPLLDASSFAVAAASLSVTRRGTSSSFPTRAELVNMRTIASSQEA